MTLPEPKPTNRPLPTVGNQIDSGQVCKHEEATMANGKSKTAKVRLVKNEATEAPVTIEKPTSSGSGLDKFKSKRTPTIAGVENLQNALPHHNIAAARDFVRLCSDEAYWSDELCFVRVPIAGQKKDLLHLIDEDIALAHLPSGKIQRFRLVLASKPHDIFFLCHVPTQNQDNSWNSSNLKACEKAKLSWVEATSRRAEGVDEYKIGAARDVDAFPPPAWPKQSLDELILVTFHGRMIDHEYHPALLRLIGAKQSVS
jgi:hypothetical protein